MQFEECHIPGKNTFLNPHFYSVPYMAGRYGQVLGATQGTSIQAGDRGRIKELPKVQVGDTVCL
jgi:hypothetical protein